MSKLTIAKTGYDVTAADENLIFNSKNVYKVGFKGTLTVNYTLANDGGGNPIGNGETSFLHNLGYIPISFAFCTDFGTQIPLFYRSGAGTALTITYRMTSSRMYISVTDTGYMGGIGDAVSIDFKYQIMMDRVI
jgi:hypothetical protein